MSIKERANQILAEIPEDEIKVLEVTLTFVNHLIDKIPSGQEGTQAVINFKQAYFWLEQSYATRAADASREKLNS